MEQENNFDSLLKVITSITGFPCSDYKVKPLKRRINSRMKVLKIDNYRDYRNYLLSNKDEIEKLKTALTINVTRFFRNYDTFKYLWDTIFPMLIEEFGELNIWSVGCASGEEPYSIAMILEDLKDKYDFVYNIFATDVDRVSLDRAIANRYNNFSMTEVPEEIKEKYFIRHSSDLWSVKSEIIKKVRFMQLNLSDIDLSISHRFNFIVCRNVLIYFEKSFQIKLISSLSDRLRKNGIFVLGRVEMLPTEVSNKFEIVNRKHRVYRKV